MFLFLRLLLGHLIGDFVLQTDRLYQAKKNSRTGKYIHTAIIFICLALFSWPYRAHHTLWLVIVIASFVHGMQDMIKLKSSNPRFELPLFMLDQLLHVLVLCPVFLFPFANTKPQISTLVLAYYSNDALIIAAISAIILTIVGGHLWQALQNSLKLKVQQQDKFIFWCGAFERVIIATSYFKPAVIIFIVIPLLLRIYRAKSLPLAEISFNILVASLVGFLLRRIY